MAVKAMRRTLERHGDTPCEAVTRIEVEIARVDAGQLQMTYRVTGKIDEVLLPPHDEPGRADDLWRHTCFETFVRTPGGCGYWEYNLSPSTRWAAYQFSDTRIGMQNAEPIGPPDIEMRGASAGFELKATLTLPGQGDLQLAISAVIEEIGGRVSYWALAHPPGRPDFHHPDGFVLDLPAPGYP